MSAVKDVLKRRSAKLLIVAAIVLILLPEIIRWGVIKGVEESGLGLATVDDVDFNLFSGQLAVDAFELTRDSEDKLAFERMAIDLSWLKLLVGTIYIEQFELVGTRLALIQLEDGGWEVVMPLSAESDSSPAEPDEVEKAITLPSIEAAQIRIADVEMTVESRLTQGVLAIDEMLIQRVSTWKEEPASITMLASWNQSPFELKTSIAPWADVPTAKADIRFDQVQLKAALPEIDGIQSATVTVDVSIDAARDAQGDINVALVGDFAIEQVATEYKNIALLADAFAWTGEAQLSLNGDQLQYALNGNLEAENFSIADNNQAVALLAWEQLLIQDVAVDEALNIGFSALEVQALDAINKGAVEKGLFYTGELTVTNVSLKEGSTLVIDRLQITDAQYDVALDKSGSLEMTHLLAQTQSSVVGEASATDGVDSDQATATTSNDPSTDFKMTLNTFDIAEGSQLSFTDNRFSVPVKQVLTIDTLSLNGLDQQNIDAPAVLTLKGQLGEFSTVVVDGTLKPFAEKLWLDIEGDIDAVDLASVSPYSEAYIGYHLSRGQYDHQFALTIANDDITLNNQLLLRKLSLNAVDSSKEQPVAQELNLPLPLALDMLRDGDDNISLDVPIEGRMDSPDVDVSSVINKALGKALKSGTSSYLKLALQPYGAAFMAAEFIGKKMSAITLDPLVFESGHSDLTEQQLAYAEKIASVLQERPKLELTLCARANEQDKVALQAKQVDVPVEEAQLVTLADERAKQVKRELLNKGIDNQRVFVCQPAYQADAASEVTVKM